MASNKRKNKNSQLAYTLRNQNLNDSGYNINSNNELKQDIIELSISRKERNGLSRCKNNGSYLVDTSKNILRNPNIFDSYMDIDKKSVQVVR